MKSLYDEFHIIDKLLSKMILEMNIQCFHNMSIVLDDPDFVQIDNINILM